MNIKHLPIILALAGATLSGCASIVSGTNQSVSVQTSPVSGAECKLRNPKGEWFVAQTPASVTVHRAYDDLTIECSKDEYKGITQVASSTKGMAFGNVLFGGIIGGGVDVGTGAAYDYPVSIMVPMQKK